MFESCIQASEFRVPAQKQVWGVVLDNFSLLHKKYSIKLMDESKAMNHRNDYLIFEFFVDDILHQTLRCNIHAKSS